MFFTVENIIRSRSITYDSSAQNCSSRRRNRIRFWIFDFDLFVFEEPTVNKRFQERWEIVMSQPQQHEVFNSVRTC